MKTVLCTTFRKEKTDEKTYSKIESNKNFDGISIGTYFTTGGKTLRVIGIVESDLQRYIFCEHILQSIEEILYGIFNFDNFKNM
jgi:hypothetical protein